MSDLDGMTVSIDDLRVGDAGDLLAEADVVIAVDTASDEEEVVHGRHEWDLARATGRDEEIVVLRVELDMEAGDIEWLVDRIEGMECGEIGGHGNGLDSDDEDDA